MTTPAADPSWPHYPDTILELHLDDGVLALDLRQRIGESDQARLERAGLAPEFAVITAHNPHGREIPAEENARRTAALVAEIAQLGTRWVRADGVSVDRTHRECGVAAVLTRDAARAIATRFEQSAYFHYDRGAVWLLGAVVEAAPRRLP